MYLASSILCRYSPYVGGKKANPYNVGELLRVWTSRDGHHCRLDTSIHQLQYLCDAEPLLKGFTSQGYLKSSNKYTSNLDTTLYIQL